jgi:glutathione S-transferase
MKLFYASASPFVRKVLIVALELGINDRIERIDVATTPLQSNPDLAAANPLGKLPALITDDNGALYDSAVICEYLAAEAGSATMLPADGPERWSTLRLQALADGLLDAAVLRRYEKAMRPTEKQSADWDEGQRQKVVRTLDALEVEADALGGEPTLGTIAVACGLGYLDFRFAHEDWREGHPRLTAWFNENWANRPSMTDTAPQS